MGNGHEEWFLHLDVILYFGRNLTTISLTVKNMRRFTNLELWAG